MPMNYSEMEQAIRTLQANKTIYEEILKETRRSEDRAKQSEERIYRTVLVIFGIVGVIFAALLGYNTWNITRVYNDLTEKVKEAGKSLKTDHDNALQKQREEFKTLETNLSRGHAERLAQLPKDIEKAKDASFVDLYSRIGVIWDLLHDPERSLEAVIMAFDTAMEIDKSYDRPMLLERMNLAISLASRAFRKSLISYAACRR